MTEKVLNDLVIESKNLYAQNNQFETTYSSTFQIRGFKPKEIGEQLDKEVRLHIKLNFNQWTYQFEKIA